MLPFDPALLSLAGPPCIGAFIGYLTNKIAIRMLFRPLRPWHLWGVRVPMTPGVIPAKRHQLAANIGEMVGRHLLTSRDIGAALSEEPFQEHLAQLVERTLAEVLRRDLGPVPAIVPRRFRAYFQVGVKTLKYRLAEGVNRYLATEDFAARLGESIHERLDALGERELNSLVTPEGRRTVYLLFDQVVSDLLVAERTAEWLGHYLADSLRRAAADGRTVADLLPAELTALLQDLVRQLAAAVLPKMGEHLADPVLRGQVLRGIQGGVEHFLDSLGPVGAMARGFLDMDSFEEKIGAYLDTRQEDLIAWLRNPEVQERMVAVLGGQVDTLLARPLADLLDRVGAERVDTLCRTGAGQLLAVFRAEGTRNGLSVLLHVGMEDLLDRGRRTMASLAARFCPGDSGRDLRATLVREVVALFRANRTERLVRNLTGAMIDDLLTVPLGRLENLVPHGVRRGICDGIVHTANRMLLAEVPGVVESLNIQRVVTDKVNGLDLLQLERLLLSIMEEQFRYINLFGALLGFLIGLGNLALLRLF